MQFLEQDRKSGDIGNKEPSVLQWGGLGPD